MKERFELGMEQAESLLHSFRLDQAALDSLVTVATKLADTLVAGKKALVCGNGGSMADAMHFAEEWSGRFHRDRRPYPVLALSDPAHLTCVANDYGFDHVFSRQVEAFGQPGDLLFLLTTSGNSRNLVCAAQAAQERKMTVIGFLGRGGGELQQLCDHVVMAHGERSDRIQELHMMVLHLLIEVVEAELGH